MSRAKKAKKRELREAIEDWHIIMEDARGTDNSAWWLSSYHSHSSYNVAEENIRSARKDIERIKKQIVALKKGINIDVESCCEEVFGY